MLDREDYYLVNDPDFCVSSLRYGIHFLRHNWTPRMAGRPTITTILQQQHLGLILFVCMFASTLLALLCRRLSPVQVSSGRLSVSMFGST